jgi:hypothetical protein
VGECGGSRKAGGAGGGGSFKKRFKKGASGEVEAEEAAPEINIGARWLTKLYSLASTASLSVSPSASQGAFATQMVVCFGITTRLRLSEWNMN